MLQLILDKKDRIKSFARDAGKGFGLMWESAPKLAIINVFLFVLQSLLPLASLLILKFFIDDLIKLKAFDWSAFGPTILFFFLLQAGGVIVTELSSYYLDLHQQVIANKLAGEVLEKAVQLDLHYFEDPAFYNELYMAQQQSLYRPAELVAALQGCIQSLITIVLFSGFLFSVHWLVPLLLVLLSIPLAVSRLLQGYQQYLLHKNNTTLERKAYDLFDYLTSYEYAKEVRLFDFGFSFVKNFQSIRKAIFLKGRRLNNRFLKYNIGIQLFEAAVIMLIFGIIIQQTVLTAVSIGGLVVYLTSFQRLQGAISSFYGSCIHLFQQQLYLQQLFRYLSIPTESPGCEKQGALILQKGIQVQNLSFVYPKTDKAVLHNINMHFPAGKVVAIVGENGSGKSTLVKLLSGLYKPEKGTILWDNTDTSTLHPPTLRSYITALFQDFGKYFLTIKENIILRNGRVDERPLNHAMERSGFWQYLPAFHKGLNTPLGRTFENGVQLSGGQWQKLALARTFFKKSPVLILDEPTSALDPVSEWEVLANLKTEMAGNRVIILISHRLYNLKVADYIYVLQEGRVAESGTFEELINKKSLFYRTYKTQMV